jgi:hypothetical protein
VDAFVAGIYDAFVDLRFDGGRLVNGVDGPVEVFLTEGRHGASGAHYRLTYPVDPAKSSGERGTLKMVVTAMDRTATTSLDISTEKKGERLATKLVLRSMAHPEVALAAGTLRRSGWPRSLHRVSWDVQIDLKRWWKQVERRGGRHGDVAVVAKITHSLAGARIAVVPRSAKNGRWTVEIVATIHGRSWARPLAFVASPFVRGSLRAEYRRAVDEFAEDWNHAAATLAHEDPNQLARDCLTPGALAGRFRTVRWPKTSDQ